MPRAIFRLGSDLPVQRAEDELRKGLKGCSAVRSSRSAPSLPAAPSSSARSPPSGRRRRRWRRPAIFRPTRSGCAPFIRAIAPLPSSPAATRAARSMAPSPGCGKLSDGDASRFVSTIVKCPTRRSAGSTSGTTSTARSSAATAAARSSGTTARCATTYDASATTAGCSPRSASTPSRSTTSTPIRACSRPTSCRRSHEVAEALRPWGVRVAIAIDFGSPQSVGKLRTFDPLDPAVAAWWKERPMRSTPRFPISPASC